MKVKFILTLLFVLALVLAVLAAPIPADEDEVSEALLDEMDAEDAAIEGFNFAGSADDEDEVEGQDSEVEAASVDDEDEEETEAASVDDTEDDEDATLEALDAEDAEIEAAADGTAATEPVGVANGDNVADAARSEIADDQQQINPDVDQTQIDSSVDAAKNEAKPVVAPTGDDNEAAANP